MENRSPDGAPTSVTRGWDTSSHHEFYRYYEQQSQSPEAVERFRRNAEMLLRVYGANPDRRPLDVLDVGCGAGAQSAVWTAYGHRYCGVDINEPLIELARRRALDNGTPARFDVGTATALPYPDQSLDISLLPELLEHVVDWQGCLDEAVRVTRPGGLLYISTSSKLCPFQQEFNLPLYAWYPGFAKRYFERRAVTDWPAVANYARYPAVNWFSYYGLRDYLTSRGFVCMDRFDLVDSRGQGRMRQIVVKGLRSVPLLRFIGHVATSYTVVVARRVR